MAELVYIQNTRDEKEVAVEDEYPDLMIKDEEKSGHYVNVRYNHPGTRLGVVATCSVCKAEIFQAFDELLPSVAEKYPSDKEIANAVVDFMDNIQQIDGWSMQKNYCTCSDCRGDKPAKDKKENGSVASRPTFESDGSSKKDIKEASKPATPDDALQWHRTRDLTHKSLKERNSHLIYDDDLRKCIRIPRGARILRDNVGRIVEVAVLTAKGVWEKLDMNILRQG